MEIDRITGVTPPRVPSVRKTEKIAQAKQPEAQTQARPSQGEDTVSLSPLSRQLAKVSEILQEDDKTRQNRIRELKQSVEDGTYEVDSEDVSRAVVSFAASNNDLLP